MKACRMTPGKEGSVKISDECNTTSIVNIVNLCMFCKLYRKLMLFIFLVTIIYGLGTC